MVPGVVFGVITADRNFGFVPSTITTSRLPGVDMSETKIHQLIAT